MRSPRCGNRSRERQPRNQTPPSHISALHPCESRCCSAPRILGAIQAGTLWKQCSATAVLCEKLGSCASVVQLTHCAMQRLVSVGRAADEMACSSTCPLPTLGTPGGTGGGSSSSTFSSPTCQHHHCTDIGTSKGRINTKYLKIDDKHGDNGCHRQMIFTDNKMQDNYINVFSLSRKF